MLTKHAKNNLREFMRADKFARKPVLQAANAALVQARASEFAKLPLGAQMVVAAEYAMTHQHDMLSETVSWALEVLALISLTSCDKLAMHNSSLSESSAYRVELEIIIPLAHITSTDEDEDARERTQPEQRGAAADIAERWS